MITVSFSGHVVVGYEFQILCPSQLLFDQQNNSQTACLKIMKLLFIQTRFSMFYVAFHPERPVLKYTLTRVLVLM
jgi:hypothetical protein